MEISNRFVKINATFEVPSDLETGRDYTVQITGSIPSFNSIDNEDGTWTREYRLKSLIGQVISQDGVSVPLKDKKSKSMQLRKMISLVWGENYDKTMDLLIAHGDELKDFLDTLK